jgi:hypothetical protein
MFAEKENFAPQWFRRKFQIQICAFPVSSNRNQSELFERPFPRIRQKLVRSMHWGTKKAHQAGTSTDHVNVTHCFIVLIHLA